MARGRVVSILPQEVAAPEAGAVESPTGEVFARGFCRL
jgi:hypothetical protein